MIPKVQIPNLRLRLGFQTWIPNLDSHARTPNRGSKPAFQTGIPNLIDSGTMTLSQLQKTIERYFAEGPGAIGDPAAMTAFLSLRAAIENGEVRAASPDPGSPAGWQVNAWVKQGILLGFRIGSLQEAPAAGFSFVDKDTYPIRHFVPADGVRLVPGGSSVRAGAYVARGVVCMPPDRKSVV